jgi:hypothetical protein
MLKGKTPKEDGVICMPSQLLYRPVITPKTMTIMTMIPRPTPTTIHRAQRDINDL